MSHIDDIPNTEHWFKKKLFKYSNDPEYITYDAMCIITEKFAQAMINKNISYKELAKCVGVSVHKIERIMEWGAKDLTIEMFVKISLALGIEFKIN